MSGFPWNMLVDLVAIALLGATVFYCVLLDRRLRAMRDGQDGLKDTIHTLNEACDRAAMSVRNLSGATEQVDEELERRLERARALADELGMILESGNNLADRLTGASTDAARRASAPVELRSNPTADTHRTVALDDVMPKGMTFSGSDPMESKESASEALRRSLDDGVERGGMPPELEKQLLDTLRRAR
ncbi:MAG: hypothetical protein ACJAVO_001176 [Parvibaculaceae bacterium]|jgi:hypothetical protein|nr:DUF6468 domain-containing protein [Parvibaculaceae bacterium]|tara:strand:- start:900 stop:1466 length:567 start_codon:yes stop_codon:yes gene_type:complete